MTAPSGCELIAVRAGPDLDAYHRIRREVLFAARGIRPYVQEQAETGKMFLLLKQHDAPVAVACLDEVSPGIAAIRGVAVTRSMQRHGCGTALIGLIEDLARSRGFTRLTASAYPGVQKFWHGLGFVQDQMRAPAQGPLPEFSPRQIVRKIRMRFLRALDTRDMRQFFWPRDTQMSKVL